MTRAFFVFLLLLSSLGAVAKTPSQSVYQIDPWADGLIIGVTSLGVTGAYYDSDLLIQARCPCDPNELNSLDRSVVGNKDDNMDRLSDVGVVTAVALPLYLDWRELGLSKEFKEDTVVFIESLTVNASLVTFAKYNVQRPLPRTYDGDPSLVHSSRGYRSFYSGHTSTVFAALSTAAYTHNLRNGSQAWPWVVTAAFGAGVGYARIAAGKHFYTDVIVAAGMGTAVGILVPWLHSRERLRNLSLLPMEDGLAVSWKRSF